MQDIIIYSAQKRILANNKLFCVQRVVCESKALNCDHFDVKKFTIRLSSMIGRNSGIS